MIWLTGDTHGHFERIEAFCREKQTTVDDILIILGDAGFNFGGGARDLALKTYASQFPITIFTLCLLYTSPSPRDGLLSRMQSSD